jgi:hypothetical protein
MLCYTHQLMFAIIVSVIIFISNIVNLIVQGVSVAKQWGEKKFYCNYFWMDYKYGTSVE